VPVARDVFLPRLSLSVTRLETYRPVHLSLRYAMDFSAMLPAFARYSAMILMVFV
jgi:hypothetical protein